MLDHAVANSRKFLELFRFLDQLFDGFGQRVDQLGGLFVTSVPADDRAINFQKLRGFTEDSGNLFVVHSWAIIAIKSLQDEVLRGKLPSHTIRFSPALAFAWRSCLSASSGE